MRGVTQPDEQVLAEGGVTHVVRVGDTVRRPVRPFTATIQSFLHHLWVQGINFVPEPLGYDEQGREVLRFVPGDVPVEPLPDWATTETVLAELARLVRRLHDAAAGWVPPPDAVWGSIPDVPPVELPPLFDEPAASTRPPAVADRGRCWTPNSRLCGRLRHDSGAESTGTASCSTASQQHAHHDAGCG